MPSSCSSATSAPKRDVTPTRQSDQQAVRTLLLTHRPTGPTDDRPSLTAAFWFNMSHRILPLRAMRSASRPSAARPVVWPAARCTAITSSLARYSTGTAAEGQSPAPTEGEQTIIEKLRSRFAGGKISVQDVSGALYSPMTVLRCFSDPCVCHSGGCGTFYAVSVAHKDFSGGDSVFLVKLAQRADTAVPLSQCPQYGNIEWSTRCSQRRSKACTGYRSANPPTQGTQRLTLPLLQLKTAPQ